MSTFSRSAFGVGFSFLRSAEQRGQCFCALFISGEPEPEQCVSFRRGLFSETIPMLVRCPAGLAMVALPLAVSGDSKALLLSDGFLEEGEGLPPGGGDKEERPFADALAKSDDDVPRLSTKQADLLVQFMESIGALFPLLGNNGHGGPSLSAKTETFWREMENSFSLTGTSPAILTLRGQLPTLANSSEPVLIESEEGNGRHLLASILHRLGPRRDRPFLTENISVLPEALHEKELFGLRGDGKGGLLSLAHGGTVFLSGIDTLSPHAQKRLAAFLSEGGQQGGAGLTIRLIVSTDRSLGELVRKGSFRSDLQRRLSTLSVFIPPLRERAEDVPVLVSHLMHRLARRDGKAPPLIDPETLAALGEYSWPGNARELSCELEKAAAFGKEAITLNDFSPSVRHAARPPKASMSTLRDAVGNLEIEMISRTLGETNWNKSKAARILGLSRLGLQKKIDRYGIDRRR